MSVKVSSWAWHDEQTAELNGNELILLLSLADVADDNGKCRYLPEDDDLTFASLARKVRVHRSTIVRLMGRLKERGLIQYEPGVKGKPNDIRILVPWATESGRKMQPNDLDSVASGTTFGRNSDEHSSYIRKDVNNAHPAGERTLEAAFESFYLVYPRKVGKQAALKAFIKAAKKSGPESIVEGVKRFANDPNLPDKQFIPYPASWLNAGRWEDEPLPPRGQEQQVSEDAYEWDWAN